MMVLMDAPTLNTTGRIAKTLGTSLCCVTYIIASGNIHPVIFAPRLRQIDREAVALVRIEFNAIDGSRASGAEGGQCG